LARQFIELTVQLTRRRADSQSDVRAAAEFDALLPGIFGQIFLRRTDG
jgi:hypothetical protein